MKNYSVDKRTSSIASLDADSNSNQTESSQKQLSHKLLLKCEAKDSSINASSASAVQTISSIKENKQCNITLGTKMEDVAGKQLLNYSHLEDEYSSFPSPPQMRSSLRSPEKIRTGLTRGFRVTFSDSKSTDYCLAREIIGNPITYYLNHDSSSTKKLHLSDTNKTNPYRLCRDTNLDSFDHLSLSSTLQNKDLKRLQKDKRATNFRDYSISHANEMKTSQSVGGDLLTAHTEMDNSTQDLLKLSSSKDLSTSTHLKSDPAHLVNRFSTLSTSFSDLTSKHQPLSAETLLENSQPATIRKTSSSAMPRKDSESAANRCLSPSRLGYKQSDRLHSSLSPQHCFKESNKESVPSDLSIDTSIRESQSPSRTEKASHIAAVLQQLLELVDHYWDGAGSLLLNKNFLTSAQDLLLYLMACTPSQKDTHLPGGDSPSILTGNAFVHQRTQLKYAEPFDKTEMALEQANALEESHMSSSRLQKTDLTAPSNSSVSGNHSLTYEELLRKNEQLNVQVESLTLELKQYKKLQETMNLLQESQRSLVSTNNFLLRQLNKEHNPNSVKTTPLPSEKLSICEKSPPLERTPPVSSAFGYGKAASSSQTDKESCQFF